jgi:hypothetical protein
VEPPQEASVKVEPEADDAAGASQRAKRDETSASESDEGSLEGETEQSGDEGALGLDGLLESSNTGDGDIPGVARSVVAAECSTVKAICRQLQP